MIDQTIVVGPFQCNCRLLACPQTGEALLIDPGDEPEKILAKLNAARTPNGQPLQLKYLLHTHGHLDHIAGTRRIYEAFKNVPQIALHKGDHELYLNLPTQAQFFGLDYGPPSPVTHFLNDQEELKVGTLKLKVLHTPGHSPGSICLRLSEDSTAQSKETLFSGDTLFQGSVGRTDLWGADQDQMFKNIHERILTLDDDTRVCPGHGPETTVGIEKRENPFLQ